MTTHSIMPKSQGVIAVHEDTLLRILFLPLGKDQQPHSSNAAEGNMIVPAASKRMLPRGKVIFSCKSSILITTKDKNFIVV